MGANLPSVLGIHHARQPAAATAARRCHGSPPLPRHPTAATASRRCHGIPLHLYAISASHCASFCEVAAGTCMWPDASAAAQTAMSLKATMASARERSA